MTGPGVPPERAVRGAWLLEHGSRAVDLTDEALVMAIPVVWTNQTVACGDWCTVVE